MQQIGTHCSEPRCVQLDFLPFDCKGCGKTFCLEHRSFTSHHCPNSTGLMALVCPICGKVVKSNPGDDPNQKVDYHISKGCSQDTISEENTTFKCSLSGCKKTEVLEIRCLDCRRNFCVSHRAPPDHNCEILLRKREREEAVLQQQAKKKETNANFSESLQKKINSNLRAAQNNPTAKKLQEMKMKQKAIGQSTIPESNRFFLEVVYGPEDATVKACVMFFNSNWSVGKVLDIIAEHGSVTNRNHEPNQPVRSEIST